MGTPMAIDIYLTFAVTADMHPRYAWRDQDQLISTALT